MGECVHSQGFDGLVIFEGSTAATALLLFCDRRARCLSLTIMPSCSPVPLSLSFTLLLHLSFCALVVATKSHSWQIWVMQPMLPQISSEVITARWVTEQGPSHLYRVPFPSAGTIWNGWAFSHLVISGAFSFHSCLNVSFKEIPFFGNDIIYSQR